MVYAKSPGRQMSAAKSPNCQMATAKSPGCQMSLDAKCLGGVWPKREMSQTPMVPGTKYQDAKRPGHGLSLPPIVLAAICLGRQISRRQMSQRLMSRSQKSWPGNVPGAKSPNANRPKRQMSAGKCLSADGEPPFVSLPIKCREQVSITLLYFSPTFYI